MDLEDLHWYTQRKHLLILISGGVIWNNLMQAKEKHVNASLIASYDITELNAWFAVTMPLVMMARGEEGRLGKRPMGWPLYITRVCSSVISLR